MNLKDVIEKILSIQWDVFFLGFIGSMAVELVKIIIIFEKGGRMPKRYTNQWYWFVRLMLAVVGGSLAVIYKATSGILAVHIGASTPIIIENFSRRINTASPQRVPADYDD